MLRLEKLLTVSGQKRWIFLPVLGSPGKAGNNRTLEVVGSTPIGSTNIFKGLDIVRPLETYPELLIVRILVRIFSNPGGNWGDRRRFLFLLCQISLLALGGFLKVCVNDLDRGNGQGR